MPAIKNEKGQFKKGVSGNPSGRPKVVKLTDKERKLFHDDPKAALLWLMNTASDRTELLRVAKLVIDYITPKLSAIKQETVVDSTLTIKWEGSDMKVIDEAKVKTIEMVDKKEMPKNLDNLTKAELKTLSNDILKTIDTEK